MNVNHEKEKTDRYTQQVITMMPMGGMMHAGQQQQGNAVMRKEPMTRKQKRNYDLIKTMLVVGCVFAGILAIANEILVHKYPYDTARFTVGSAINTILVASYHATLMIVLICILRMPKRRKIRSCTIAWMAIVLFAVVMVTVGCRAAWRYQTYSNPQEDVIYRYKATFRFMNRHLPNYKNIMKIIFDGKSDHLAMMENIAQLVVTAPAENSTAQSTTTTAKP